MSDGEGEGQFAKDSEVDKPGIVGARWWHHTLIDADGKVQRRQVLVGFAVAGGVIAAISALGVGIATLADDTESTALATRKALDMQRQYGWDFGARGTPLVFDGVAEGPFVRTQLDTLGSVMTPAAGGPNLKYHVGTLLESLLARPAASLPDPMDGRPAPDAAPFKRVADVLMPVVTPAMVRAYRAGEALARISGWRQGLAVLVDLAGPESVAFAAGAANIFEPVLLLDNWPHPHGVVPSHLTLAALAYYQPRFASQRERPFSAPLFVIDRLRLDSYSEASDRFDNRYLARMPKLPALAKDGVRALLYVVASPDMLPELADLSATLADRSAGPGGEPPVEVRALALTDFAPDPAKGGDALHYQGSAKADARFWDDYSFEPQTALAASARPAAPRDHRFAARPAAPAAGIGIVPVVATASGLVLAAALDRQGSLNRFAGGWSG